MLNIPILNNCQTHTLLNSTHLLDEITFLHNWGVVDIEFGDFVSTSLSGLAEEKGKVVAYTKHGYIIEVENETEFGSKGKIPSKVTYFLYDDEFEANPNKYYLPTTREEVSLLIKKEDLVTTFVKFTY